MESKKLEAMLIAVDLGSFTKAAEVLGYTQSGLTHMMNSLEREIGFPLLDRGRYGVRLTEEGERIAPAIRDFLQANANLVNAIAQVSTFRNETIRVAAFASMAMHWLPTIIQQFRTECPNVDVDIRMADNVEAPYELLNQGKMDIVFASRQELGQYDWIHLQDDVMYAVLPQDYDLGGRSSFPLSEFDGKEFIMPSQGFDKDIMRVLNREGVRPDIRPTSVDDATVIGMVEHGLGLSMMTELTLRGRAEHVRIVPVKPFASRELGLALRSSADMSQSLRRFVACVQRLVPQL